MGKAKRAKHKKAKVRGAEMAAWLVRPANLTRANMHPVMVRALSNGAQLTHADYEVAAVPNPHGEVVIRGEVRRHKAVRRVPRFETLYRSKVIDDTVFACLAWYAARLAVAQGGLIRCGLDVSGAGGGSALHHIPTTQVAMEARADVEWARGFIPKGGGLRDVFDGVMGSVDIVGDADFRTIGAAVWPGLCVDWAARKASKSFAIAANHLLKGAGPKVLGTAWAA